MNIETINSTTEISGAMLLFIIFGSLFGIAIFIIWVWAMLAVIDFSTNFKKFLELYEQKESKNYSIRNFTNKSNEDARAS